MSILSLVFILVVILFSAVLIFFISIKRKKVTLVIVSILLFIIAIAVGIFIFIKSSYIFYSKAKNKAEQVSKAMSGIEIYESFFGQQHANCVNIVNSHDAAMPVIDYAVYLEGTTCANEIKRIISSKYSIKKIVRKDTIELNYIPDEPKWFTVNLGKEYIEANYFNNTSNNSETFCFNTDSTKFVYCKYIN